MKKIPLSTLLWICYSVFIVYATTIPFNVIKSNAELKHNISIISWKPFYNTEIHAYFPRGNLIANVLFFIPFGFFGLYSLQNNKWRAARRVFVLSLLGTCLSALVEFLQMFTVDRNTSDTDLITNTLGTIVGIICARLIKPSSMKHFYSNHVARFAQVKTAFPFMGVTLVILAGGLAPFDFAIDRSEIASKLHTLFSPSRLWDLNKKDFVVFLYYGALLSFMSAMCLKQWSIKMVNQATIYLGLTIAILVEGMQLFMTSRFPSWGSFSGVLAGIFAGLVTEWFASWHYRGFIAWFLLVLVTMLLLFFNFAPPVQNASKLGSFLRFSSHGTESIKGLMNFIQITAQFIPVGFIIACLCSPGKRRTLTVLSIFFLPLSATPLFVLGFPSLYDVAVLVIAEVAVFIGAAACLWAWPIFNYYCQKYANR